MTGRWYESDRRCEATGGTAAVVFAVDGVLPTGTGAALSTVAEDLGHRGIAAGFASAIIGSAPVTLLSFLLQGVNSVQSRITMVYIGGVLLALGPFDHVIVTALHVVFGADVGYGLLAEVLVVTTAGNLVGGLGLVTVTHIAQAIGAEK